MKILFVEDNDFVRHLIRDQLTSEGYEVVSAITVDEAIEALKEHTFQMLITDIVLPGKDGVELMKHVRTRGINIPVLAITGGIENAQEDYTNYADMFADQTLTKPIHKDVLIEAITRLCGQDKP